MMILPKARSKYKNQKVYVDAHEFDSKKEARRYGELKLMQRLGLVRNLEIHKRYPIYVNERLICNYEADFVYEEEHGDAWRRVVEDCKGVRTRDYVLKKKLMHACNGIDIKET